MEITRISLHQSIAQVQITLKNTVNLNTNKCMESTKSCNIYNVNIHYFYNSMEVKKNLKITEKIRKYNPPADQTESK